MGAEAIGVLAASVIQGLFVNKYRIAGECDENSKITAEELKNQIVQGNLALFCTHSLDLGEHFSTFITILLVSAILFIPIWQVVLVKIGKKKSFAIGMIIFIPVLISQLYIPGNVYAYYPILVLAGISIAVALLLPWSMLPDVLDEFMLQTGTRQDAIFYSFYVFFNKLAVGVGLGLSQLALGIGGYKTGECDQPASVGLALRYLVVPGPVIFTLIALLILWRYPIDENRRKQIKKELEQLKADRKPSSKEVDQVEDPPPPDEIGDSVPSAHTKNKFSVNMENRKSFKMEQLL
ncbi:MFSD2A [Mytilus coruscus]|uniref:MFSD2A n=1 Tax=Mytilus coruscus TaxID=42192 RepID=A0A6J8CVY1_MYTCO|nr:MFSD2A [Mytilus coruscus]